MGSAQPKVKPLPPHFREGIHFECQGTGRCCTSKGQEGYVYMNLPDRRRLAKHLKISTQAFTRKYCKRDGEFFHLKDCFNQCRFLDGTQCGVYAARPFQCRSFPFWPQHLNAKTWNQDVVSSCAGIGKGRYYSPDEITALIALTDL